MGTITREWTDSGLIVKHSGTLNASCVFREVAEVASYCVGKNRYVVTDLTNIKEIDLDELDGAAIGGVIFDLLSLLDEHEIHLRWTIVCSDGIVNLLRMFCVEHDGGGVLDISYFADFTEALSWARGTLHDQ